MRVEFGQIVGADTLNSVVGTKAEQTVASDRQNAVKEQQEEERAKKASEEKQAQLKEEVLGKVISTSRDGDELRTSQAGEAGKEDQITDLTGVSESRLETLHLQGKVDQFDYEQKLDKLQENKENLGIGVEALREQEKKRAEEKAKEKAEEKKAEELKARMEEDDKTSNQNIQSPAAVNDQEKKTVIREEDQKNNASQNDKDEKAQNQVQENIEFDKESAERLGAISAKQMDTENKANAYQNAMENDRVDLMNSIFGVENR